VERRTADSLVESTVDYIVWHVVQQHRRHTVNLVGGGLAQNIFGRDLPLAKHSLEHLFVHFPRPHASGASAYFPIYARDRLVEVPQTHHARERVWPSTDDELSTFVNGVEKSTGDGRQTAIGARHAP
ncbi:MAG TPA: hypothetical protein VLD36_22425, partial [Burkholderiales bacterium]|nr:hypothetical protein [Burkholderiales bacterium]